MFKRICYKQHLHQTPRTDELMTTNTPHETGTPLNTPSPLKPEADLDTLLNAVITSVQEMPARPAYAPFGARVYLGMSGGVDSALSAALLQEWGYDVKAIYMRNWSRDLPGFKCTWADDLADAERLAVKLGLTLEVWDCEKEYKETVVDYLINAYQHGFTPNPDVMCNQTVKFGTFATRAFEHGADFIATGHYARVYTDSHNSVHLLRAADEHKDQTYFLWRVKPSLLEKTIFPIGSIASKEIVRQMCATRGLGIESKPDSDGICFIGEVGIRTFLLDTLSKRAGDIIEWETGNVLGHHDGAFLYTIGQRKGLNLGGGPARYVVGTDTEKNRVYVTANTQCPDLWCQTMVLDDVYLLNESIDEHALYQVRLRHTGKLQYVHVKPIDDHKIELHFESAVPKIAAGQSAVIYQGKICVGGGIIQKQPLHLSWC